jgi:hypothetical protein
MIKSQNSYRNKLGNLITTNQILKAKRKKNKKKTQKQLPTTFLFNHY